MAEAQVHPDFGQRFREQFLTRRRRALLALLDRAAAHDQLAAHTDPGTAADVIFGTLWYRIMGVPGPLGNRLADELVSLTTRS